MLSFFTDKIWYGAKQRKNGIKKKKREFAYCSLADHWTIKGGNVELQGSGMIQLYMRYTVTASLWICMLSLLLLAPQVQPTLGLLFQIQLHNGRPVDSAWMTKLDLASPQLSPWQLFSPSLWISLCPIRWFEEKHSLWRPMSSTISRAVFRYQLFLVK